MITTAIITILYTFIYAATAPFRLLADVSLPAAVASAVNTASNYLANSSQLFPVDTLLAVVFLVLVVEGYILGWKFLNWVIRKIPGIN